MYRTHTCGELRTENIGISARLAGWVDTIRDHGGVKFLDLRDAHGVTQVVFNDDSLLEGIHRETAVCVSGVVEARDEENVNQARTDSSSCARYDRGPRPVQKRPAVRDPQSTATREEVRSSTASSTCETGHPSKHRAALARNPLPRSRMKRSASSRSKRPFGGVVARGAGTTTCRAASTSKF
jgi:hypothetical protein